MSNINKVKDKMNVETELQKANLEIEYLKKIISNLEKQIDNYDANLKLVICSKMDTTQRAMFNASKIRIKLFEALETNQDRINQDLILQHLETTCPAYVNMSMLLHVLISGHESVSLDSVIIKNNDKILYMDEHNNINTMSLNDFSEEVCTKLYNVCQSLVREKCELTKNTIEVNDTNADELNEKDNNRVSNLSLLKLPECQEKIMKKLFAVKKS